MTFTRALQIRRLAAELPLDAIVLETDAPDIAPELGPPGPQQPGAAAGDRRGAGRTARPADADACAPPRARSALAAIPRLTTLLAA